MFNRNQTAKYNTSARTLNLPSGLIKGVRSYGRAKKIVTTELHLNHVKYNLVLEFGKSRKEQANDKNI